MLRATWKSLLARKVRLLMSTTAIVLGVAFVVGTLVFSDSLNRSFTALFASTVGDVVVKPEGQQAETNATTRTVPGRLVDKLATVPGAERADGMVNDFGTYVVDEDGKVVGGNGAPGIGSNWSDAPAGHGLEGISIIGGREPQGPDEVVLDSATASRAGYTVGEEVHLVSARSQTALRPTLVGIAGFPDGGSLNGATLVSFETGTAQRLYLDGADDFSELWVTAESGTSQEELAAAVSEVLPAGFEAVTGDEQAEASASDLLEAIGFLTTFLLVFAGIALVVGAFLIVNTFSILVAQRSRELALLRALGASGRQVTRSVMLEAVALGLLGSTLGVGLGYLLALGIRWLFAQFGLDISGQPMVIEPLTLVAAYAVGLVVTVAAAWLPARRTARIAPVQALRDDVAMPESSLRRRFVAGIALCLAGGAALATGLMEAAPRPGWWVGAGVLAILLGVAAASPVISRPFLAVAAWLMERVFGSVGRLAGANGLRNPRRTTATASALMIGLALASTMAIVGDSAKASVDKLIGENFRGDYVVGNVMGMPFSSGVARQMQDVDGVEKVTAQRWAFGQIDGQDQAISAADRAGLTTLGTTTTRGDLADLEDGTAVVASDWADEEGIEVGDELEVSINGVDKTLPVVAAIEPNPLVSFPVVTTPATLASMGLADGDNALVVDVADGAGVPTREALDAVVADNPLVTVKDQQAFAAEQRAPIDQMVLMIYALLGLALLIAVLGIVNTLALSVIERTREVGLLRAVGLRRGQLRWMVTLESVVIAVLGATLGAVLGVGFGIALMQPLRAEGLEVVSVPFGQLGLFLAAAVVVGVLAAVLPARRAARLDVLDAIGTE